MNKTNTYDISIIDGMEGHKFEYFCADLLQKVGFSDVSVTPGSGDQGVDVLATKDGIRYAIQCKNYSSALSNTPVQEVSAGKQFYGCHVGAVMTNSCFTPRAIQLATATNVLLWDRTKLQEFISMTGGLESYGIYPEYDELDSDSQDDCNSSTIRNNQTDSKAECYTDNGMPTTQQYNITGNKRHRRGMSILAMICYAWSVICLFVFVIGFAESEKIFMIGGIAEGLFMMAHGVMFSILAKSEKWNPHVVIRGKYIKKPLFVFVSIVIAYMLFMGAFGIMGGFDEGSYESGAEETIGIVHISNKI